MRPVKLLHTSDIHIDWPFDHFNSEAGLQRRKDLFTSFERLCELAISEGVDGLLIAGDLFHSGMVDRHSVAVVVSWFIRLTESGIKVIVLPGNHDPGVKSIIENSGQLPRDVFVFSGDTWQDYRGIAGVSILGHPFVERKASQRVLRDLPLSKESPYTLGMLHGSLSGLPYVEGEYFPISPKDIEVSGFDYLALGHYHNYRDCSAGNTLCFYPGSPERLSFNNLPERTAVMISLQNGRAGAAPVIITTRPYTVLEFDMGTGDLPKLYAQLGLLADSEAAVRVNIDGFIKEQDMFTATQIEEHYRNRFFSLEIRDRTRIIPCADSADKTVKGIFLNKIQARLAMDNLSEEEQAVLTEALRVGLTVLEGGKL